jgi:hypothetical protein
VVTFTAPSSGASTSPAVKTATIGPSGQASVSVTANSVAGSYTVTASARGVATPARFSLTNTVSPAARVALSGARVLSREVPIRLGDGADMPLADPLLHDNALAQWDGLADAGFPQWIAARKHRASLSF